MRKIIFFYSTGYCGMDGNEVVEYPDDVTDLELDDHAWTGAIDNAEMYGVELTNEEDYDEDGYVKDDEDTPCYAGDSIEGWWEDYDPEKHDGLV